MIKDEKYAAGKTLKIPPQSKPEVFDKMTTSAIINPARVALNNFSLNEYFRTTPELIFFEYNIR